MDVSYRSYLLPSRTSSQTKTSHCSCHSTSKLRNICAFVSYRNAFGSQGYKFFLGVAVFLDEQLGSTMNRWHTLPSHINFPLPFLYIELSRYADFFQTLLNASRCDNGIGKSRDEAKGAIKVKNAHLLTATIKLTCNACYSSNWHLRIHLAGISCK